MGTFKRGTLCCDQCLRDGDAQELKIHTSLREGNWLLIPRGWLVRTWSGTIMFACSKECAEKWDLR